MTRYVHTIMRCLSCIERKRSLLIGLSTRMDHEGCAYGSICGTPCYMAPEIVRAAAPVTAGERAVKVRYTPAADTWAAGVSLLIMLTGTIPFGDPLVAQTEHATSGEALPGAYFESRLDVCMTKVSAAFRSSSCALEHHVASAACDMLRQMLIVDASIRPTAATLLSRHGRGGSSFGSLKDAIDGTNGVGHYYSSSSSSSAAFVTTNAGGVPKNAHHHHLPPRRDDNKTSKYAHNLQEPPPTRAATTGGRHACSGMDGVLSIRNKGEEHLEATTAHAPVARRGLSNGSNVHQVSHHHRASSQSRPPSRAVSQAVALAKTRRLYREWLDISDEPLMTE